MMLAVVTYDITSNRRRARLHRALKEFGINTQKSVFECDADLATLQRIVALARQLVDVRTDSFRIYRLCRRCQRQVAVSGLGLKVMPLDFKVL